MRRNGFTLIEMMFVVLILGLATSMAVPPLMAWQRDMGLATATDRFERVHELTRVTAIREARIAELHVDTAGGRFWVEVDTSGTGISDTIAMVPNLENDVRFSSDRTLLCFDARGLPTAAGACEAADATLSFTTATSGQTETTQITLLGKVIR